MAYVALEVFSKNLILVITGKEVAACQETIEERSKAKDVCLVAVSSGKHLWRQVARSTTTYQELLIIGCKD
jgi:hypothetical protein